jgi:drug/metabolite transporter (DMT)-like permease
MREVGPRRSALITYINLVVSALLGVFLLSEPITPGVVIGLPLIVAGSYLAGKHRGAYVRKKDRVSS